FAAAGGRLIGRLRQVALASCDPNPLMAPCDAHIWIRPLQVTQQLIGTLLERDAPLPVIIRFEARNHHAVCKRSVHDAAVRRNRHRASLPILSPVIRISELKVGPIIRSPTAGGRLWLSIAIVRGTIATIRSSPL